MVTANGGHFASTAAAVRSGEMRRASSAATRTNQGFRWGSDLLIRDDACTAREACVRPLTIWRPPLRAG
jgi:hypothetical protein